METKLVLSLKQVRKYVKDGSSKVRLTFHESFPGIRTNDDGDFIKTEIDYIDMPNKVFMAQLIESLDSFDIIASGFAGLEQGAVLARLTAILRKSKFHVVRTEFAEGDMYVTSDGEEVAHEFAGFQSSIEKVVLSESGEEYMTKIIDSLLGL